MSDEIFLARRRLNFGKELAQKGWYHSIDLLDGTVTDGLIPIERLERRVACMPIPADLRGKRVLDIGAWDGWFSFEMERRGAEVVAVDCVEIENFIYAHDARKSKVEYRILDVMELSPRAHRPIAADRPRHSPEPRMAASGSPVPAFRA